MIQRFSPAIARKLCYYVYAYVDPRDGFVFYVGKGKGNRAFAHLEVQNESRKTRRIQEIRETGQEPRIDILVHGLQDENAALKIEAALIDLLGRTHLTNEMRGYKSRSHGRMTVAQIHALYGATRGAIAEPTLLFKVNRLYRHTMSPRELYDVTRGYWRLGLRRQNAKLAMTVYEGIVRAVFVIVEWHHAGTTLPPRYSGEEIDLSRWEFTGHDVTDALREKYVNRWVGNYWSKGAQSPVAYVNM